ncbi:formate dehydrogenase [Variovorax soli]|uniref:formate dehydrogenase n=1 Tax=Variovorax soli TaxID=376815 RepID=UPI0008383C65|nr:formate dehydrogenase [Variovorax soli]
MQDSQVNDRQKSSRRSFFAGAAGVGAAAAAVAVLPKVEATNASPASSAKPAPDKGGGYQLSEHVKRYYRTTSA